MKKEFVIDPKLINQWEKQKNITFNPLEMKKYIDE